MNRLERSTVNALAVRATVSSRRTNTHPVVLALLLTSCVAGGLLSACGGSTNPTGPPVAGQPTFQGVTDLTVPAGDTAVIDLRCFDPDSTVTTITNTTAGPNSSFDQMPGTPGRARYRQTTSVDQVGQGLHGHLRLHRPQQPTGFGVKDCADHRRHTADRLAAAEPDGGAVSYELPSADGHGYTHAGAIDFTVSDAPTRAVSNQNSRTQDFSYASPDTGTDQNSGTHPTSNPPTDADQNSDTHAYANTPTEPDPDAFPIPDGVSHAESDAESHAESHADQFPVPFAITYTESDADRFAVPFARTKSNALSWRCPGRARARSGSLRPRPATLPHSAILVNSGCD